jgi:hypothetical protein
MIALMLSACGGTVQTLPTATTTPTATATEESGLILPEVTVTPPVDLPTEDTSLEATATNTVEDVCSLVTGFNVEEVLGQPVTKITPGAEPDDVTGGTLNYCTFLGSGKAVVISSVEVDNSYIGLDILNAQIQSMQDDEPDTKINQELGVGIKAYWSVSDHAGGYTVLTEEHVFSVILGGDIGNALDHKAALLALAQIVEKNQIQID